ncbi:hypothetical protein [Halostella pelagica]|uniref:hypothetical protein n=1 Tax=Halostella pelagica TaxID=2583824 RepID=UPI0010811CF7|nr:hypothetical protein [Halostella pelagica]
MEKPDASNSRSNCKRRSVLKATGLGAALPVFGGVATASGNPSESQGESDNADPPSIHSHFGYSGTSDDEIPNRLEPDETVELHVDEDKIDDTNLPALTAEFGAFHFAPVGLHLEPGAIVEFDFCTPEHTATAYHPGQERQ